MNTNPPQKSPPKQYFAPAEAARIVEACREFSVRHLYLFGSLARGEAQADSDVDLLVEFERDGVAGAFDQFMGFKERMESILGRPVDIITAKRFRNPYFQQAVEAEKQLIYAACPGIGAGERSKGLDLPDQPRIRLHHQHLPHLSTMCTTGGFFLSGHKKEEGHQ